MEILAESRESGTMEHLFCTIGGGGAAENRLISLGAKVIVLGLRTKIPNLLAIERLFRLFRKTQPVAVHTHGAEANFHGLIAARLAGVSVRIGEELAFQPIVERLALFFDIFTGLRTGW
ncbi:MAG: glycosyltransferase [Pseudohongiellaceae bacterium]